MSNLKNRLDELEQEKMEQLSADYDRVFGRLMPLLSDEQLADLAVMNDHEPTPTQLVAFDALIGPATPEERTVLVDLIYWRQQYDDSAT